MKSVFNNQMVAHVWAQMNQPHGRNSSNSKHFDDSLAYSYRTPVAHIVETRGAGRILLYVPNKWGNTTAKHIYSYRLAFNGGAEYEVPDIFPYGVHRNHKENVAYLLSKYAEERARLMRVPCDSGRVRNLEAYETLRTLARRVEGYCAAFNVDGYCPPDYAGDSNAIVARRDRLLADPKRAAKREARAIAEHRRMLDRTAEQYARNAEGRIAWYRGDDAMTIPRLSDENGGALLRIGPSRSAAGITIQTSWGAEVPVPEATALLPRLFAARANLRGTVLNLKCDWGIGHFSVNCIDTAGIVAGCHTIHWAELERIAAALGVPS